MGRDWLVDGLEFLNWAGTHRFRLAEASAGGPILLLCASAKDPSAPFENVSVNSKTAIPVLALLAHQASEGAGVPKKDWIYDVVWGNKGLDWPYKKALHSSNRNTVEKVAPIIRALVGEETVEAVDGGYRLTVPVQRVPINTSPVLPETDPQVVAPAPIPHKGGSPSANLATEGSLTPAESRAEEHARWVSSPVARGRIFRLPSGFAWLAALAVIAGVVVFWFLVGNRSAGLPASFFYSVAVSGFLLAALVCRQIFRRRKTNTITIRVARLGTDQQGRNVQELVMDSINRVLGPQIANIQRAEIELSVAVGDEDNAYAAAHRFLRKEKCDVLIWGKVYSLSQMKDRLFVRFSTPDFDHRPNSSFEFTPEYSLESDFAPEMGTVLAAVAASLALPSSLHAGVFMSTILEPTANKLAKLAGGLDQMHAVDRGALLQSYGLIQLTIGAQSGDGLRLKEAADALRTATNALSRQRVPFSWALSQNSLGTALTFLGNQEVGTDLLKEAVSAYEAALDEWAGDQMQSFRRLTLHNLGVTLSQIGQRESGSEHLKKGIAVLRDALNAENGRRSAAHVKASLGAALTRLAEREGDERGLEEAVELARSSAHTFLYQFPPMPLSWARGNIALAIALRTLGEWQGRVELLEEAASALRGASKVMSRDRAPLQWVDIQIRLAATLIRQGDLDDSSSSLLHESVSVIRGILEEPLRDRYPHEWAMAQNTLGVASSKIGMHENNTAWLQAAERAFRNVLEAVSRDRAPAFWAVAKNGLASTLAALGTHKKDKSRIEEAVAYFHEAAEECTRENDPMGWAFAQHDLAVALISLGVLFEAGTKSLEEAARTLRTVLDEWTPERAPAIHKRGRPTLEAALSMIRTRSGSATADSCAT